MLRPAKITVDPGGVISYAATYQGGTILPLGTPFPASPFNGSNWSLTTLEEYMDDEQDKGRLVTGMKPCTHIKITRKRLAVVTDCGGAGYQAWYNSGDHNAGFWRIGPCPVDDTYYIRFGDWTNLPESYLASVLGRLDAPIPGVAPIYVLPGTTQARSALNGTQQLTNLVSSAFKSMLPGIKPSGGISLINSIIELKDFGTVPRTFSKIRTGFSSIKSLSSFKGLFDSRLRNSSIRKILKASADSYLQKEFNFQPLLSDIASVQDALVNTRNRLKELIKRADQPQKRHFAVPLVDTYPDQNLEVARNCISAVKGNVFRAGKRMRYVDRLFCATLEYSYSLPSMPEELALLGAYLDALGVNLNPKIIWNAIPWSFVIDWVVNIGSWLDNWRSRNIEPVVNIRGACWSVHVSRVTSSYIGVDNAADPCVELWEEVYERKPLDRSALYAQLTTSGLNLKEFSLGAALAVSR